MVTEGGGQPSLSLVFRSLSPIPERRGGVGADLCVCPRRKGVFTSFHRKTEIESLASVRRGNLKVWEQLVAFFLLGQLLILLFNGFALPQPLPRGGPPFTPYHPSRGNSSPMGVGEAEEVMIVVLAHPRGDRVSCSFPRTLSPKEVKDYLQRLTQVGGWKAERVMVSTVRLTSGPMTSFEFTSPFVVIPSMGTFDLNPFLQAFKTLRKIGIVYLVPPTFQYKGIHQFEDKHLKLWLESHPGVYQFHIIIKDPRFEDFRLPFAITPSSDHLSAASQENRSDGGKGWVKLFFLFFGLGLVLAFFTYWWALRVHQRGSVNCSRPGEVPDQPLP